MSNQPENQWPSWLPLRKDLSGLKPYGAPQVAARSKLNTNENPFSISEVIQRSVAKEISKELGNLNRYPDRDVIQLRRELARYINKVVKPAGIEISFENIWPANGSNEVLQTIMMALGGPMTGLIPSYSMHPLIAKTIGVNFSQIKLPSNFEISLGEVLNEIDKNKPNLFFLTTPNNPTGRSVSYLALQKIVEKTASYGGMVIIDEAYGEFSRELSAISLLAESPSLIVVRTMSKAFAFAGTRIGYAIARDETIRALQLVRLPYHLSSLTQAAGLAALKHSDDLLADVERIKVSRDQVSSELISLGLEVIPSDANFILFGGFSKFAMSAPILWQELLNRGVLIRDVGIEDYLRVTIGQESENQLFIHSLREILHP
jgi:histidinol-phosphate aminotransferase